MEEFIFSEFCQKHLMTFLLTLFKAFKSNKIMTKCRCTFPLVPF